MLSMLLHLGLAGLAFAAPAPAPQDIDFDLAYQLPNPTYTTTMSQVTYDAATILQAAVAQITSSATEDSAAVPSADKVKRAACASQPAGAGPVPSPDTASKFQNNPAFASAAAGALPPSGYSQTFSNLQASNNAYGYMGYTTLQSYNPQQCASKCNAITGCVAINIYFERDPTVEPAAGCPNPASTTNIKCVFWGGPVTKENALNTGQYRNQFQVVIAGSNGYVSNSVASPAGYGLAIPLGNAAINAPYDKYGFDSYMGSAIFTSGPFSAQLCADACSMKSAYNKAHPPTDGSPVQTCQFFNTYILYMNGPSNPQGQYCAMYSESWPASYATNKGQYRGSDQFTIQYSFAYSNSADPGAPCKDCAVHQASRDISYSSLQPYCSSLLGYTIPVATATVTATQTPSTITTTTTTTSLTITTAQVFVKRQEESVIHTVSTSGSVLVKVVVTATASLEARAAAPTPDSLTKYPGDVVASACSLQVSSATSTSTQTVTTTSTQSPVTTTQVLLSYETATVTATSTTSTSTPSSIPANVPCGQTYQASPGYQVTVLCNTRYASGGYSNNYGLGATSQPSFASCVKKCTDSPYCFALQYNVALSECTTYGLYAVENYHVKDAEGFVFLYISEFTGVVKDN
ncbi:glycoside hydrolase [Hortaea werneckii]|nr:glycoside hydrolase [Hortaea werneckii]